MRNLWFFELCRLLIQVHVTCFADTLENEMATTTVPVVSSRPSSFSSSSTNFSSEFVKTAETATTTVPVVTDVPVVLSRSSSFSTSNTKPETLDYVTSSYVGTSTAEISWSRPNETVCDHSVALLWNATIGTFRNVSVQKTSRFKLTHLNRTCNTNDTVTVCFVRNGHASGNSSQSFATESEDFRNMTVTDITNGSFNLTVYTVNLKLPLENETGKLENETLTHEIADSQKADNLTADQQNFTEEGSISTETVWTKPNDQCYVNITFNSTRITITFTQSPSLTFGVKVYSSRNLSEFDREFVSMTSPVTVENLRPGHSYNVSYFAVATVFESDSDHNVTTIPPNVTCNSINKSLTLFFLTEKSHSYNVELCHLNDTNINTSCSSFECAFSSANKSSCCRKIDNSHKDSVSSQNCSEPLMCKFGCLGVNSTEQCHISILRPGRLCSSASVINGTSVFNSLCANKTDNDNNNDTMVRLLDCKKERFCAEKFSECEPTIVCGNDSSSVDYSSECIYNHTIYPSHDCELKSCGASVVLQEGRMLLDDLAPITTYKISIYAMSKELHIWNTSLSCETKETLPGMVQNLTTKTSPGYLNLSVEWDEPRIKSGRHMKYAIALYCNKGNKERISNKSTEERKWTFNDLIADAEYIVQVAGITDVGTGEIAETNVTIPISKPHVAMQDALPTATNISQNHFVVILKNPFSKRHGPVTLYSVMVTHNGSWENDQHEHCDGKRCYPVVSNCSALFNGETNTDNCKTIVSTEPARGVAVLVIGMDKGCGNNCKHTTACNHQLQPSTAYRVWVRGYNSIGDHTDGPKSKLIITKAHMHDDSNQLVNALVAILIVLVVVAAVVIAFLYFRWQNPSFRSHNISRRPNHIPMAALPTLLSKPINAVDFVEHVGELEKDSGLLFTDEFEELKYVGRDQPWDQAELPCNRAKNRFTNILPYDSTRVKLLPIEDVEGSDYINANWIPGFSSKREFIATQGPMPSTKDDLWRLVWEYNCRAVVMLTLCMENGRIKCDQYWPMDSEPLFYGDLQIKIMHEIITSSWHIRELQISLGEQMRRIRHFHYLEWPDMKVPDKLSMLSFVRQVRSYVNSKVGGPVVVHCSAGVGRSGTFVALDVLIQQLEQEEVVDVYGVVLRMRLGRVLMVQTEQQYIFIYECMKHIVMEQAERSHIKTGAKTNVPGIENDTANQTDEEKASTDSECNNAYDENGDEGIEDANPASN